MTDWIPKTDDKVYLEYEGRVVEAYVMLASPNGKSLMLMFDALLGGHLGMMPVTTNDKDEYESLIEGLPVKLSPLSSTKN